MKTRFNRKNSERGFALMIVMVVIFVLSALVGGLAYTMKVESQLARNYDNDVEMEFLGRSGMELARYVLTEKDKIPGQGNVEALNQKWAENSGGTPGNPMGETNDFLSDISLTDVPMGNGSFTVKITDMERKFSINYAANPQAPLLDIFQNAFNVMGVSDPGLASTATDSILDWVDPDDRRHLSGAENDYYKDLGYLCKNDGFDDITELLLVKGIWDHRELYDGPTGTNNSVTPWQQRIGAQGYYDPSAQPPPLLCSLTNLFSVYFMDQRLNINTADEKVLQLLPGVDADLAASIVSQRTRDGIPVPFQNPGEVTMNTPNMNSVASQSITRYCGVRSNTFEVEVDAQIGDYKRTFYGILRRMGRDFQLIKFYWN